MLKKVVVPLVIGGALLVGGVSVGTAYAGSPASTSSAPTSVATGAPAQTGQLHLRAWLRAHRHQIRRQAVIVSAKALGMTPKALVAELRSGQSIAGVAAQRGTSVQTVTTALTGAATAKINQAVADGKLTTVQGQKIESHLPTFVSRVVNHVRRPR